MAHSRPGQPHPEPSWWGWGDPEQVPELPAAVRELLAAGLGVRSSGAGPGARSLEGFALRPVRIETRCREELVAAVGEGNLRVDAEARLRHTRGKSTLDLLAMRAGDAGAAPDLVALPASHEEVLRVLEVCSARRIAVVPYGGGTSVVGGLEPRAASFAGVLALDLQRMNALVSVDPESRLAVLEPGLRGPEAEALLDAEGFTIGHFPQSFQYATLGGFAAARSSGQASAGYGRFDDNVLALRLATPRGTLSLGRAPRSAAGPDLRQLILGSEGALGAITSLTVQVRPVPEARVYEGWRFASFAEGLSAVRWLAQDGPLPTVLRLSDEAETALNLARPGELGGGGEGSLAIAGYEGGREQVAGRREEVARALRSSAPTVAGPDREAGKAWARDRYRGPYLRDALLGARAFVETLETVAFWSKLPRLHEAVGAAVRESLAAEGAPAVVLCHVSHVYPAGASLYFTVAFASHEDPAGRWRRAKAAASEAILAAGGSISHHHGVGTYHLPWYAREIGELGLAALRAVKAELDPEGILNPGVLIPPSV